MTPKTATLDFMNYQLHCRNKRLKVLILALIPSIIRQLKLDSRNISVYIMVHNNIADDAKVTYTPIGYIVQVKSSNNYVNTLTSLCHELVHVKQIASGKLVDGKFWCGRDYSKTEYLYQPWEVQAFALQDILFRRAFAEVN